MIYPRQPISTRTFLGVVLVDRHGFAIKEVTDLVENLVRDADSTGGCKGIESTSKSISKSMLRRAVRDSDFGCPSIPLRNGTTPLLDQVQETGRQLELPLKVDPST